MTATRTSPEEIAVELAKKHRLPVFPCAPDKKPLTKHGFKDASTDENQIRRWWAANPDALIGVPTGAASGLLVIDIDPAGAGFLSKHCDELATGRQHMTPRGRHCLFQHPRGVSIRCSAGKLAEGVDVRADGGYIIWWPSQGRKVSGLEIEALPPPPKSLLDRLTNPSRIAESRTSDSSATNPHSDAQLHESLASRDDAPRAGVPPERGTYAPPSLMRTHQVVEGGRNSYLTREAGRLRRLGHDEPVLLAALTAINSKDCSPPLPHSEVQIIARSVSRYTPAEDAALLQTLDLRVGKSGVIADEENIRRILSRDPDLAGIVRFDEFRSELVLTRPVPGDVENVIADRNTPRPWKDSDTVALQTYIQRRFIPRVGRDKIEGVVDLQAREHCTFHPVRDYLQSCKWDGTPRLDTWLRNFMGASQQPERYLSAVGSKFFIAAVARIFDPGCQVDSVMVLEGRQGSNKSSALRAIAGDEYFSDSLPADLSQKDARDHLRGKWIIELSELAQFKRGEIETIKAFISRRHEQYRPSYGRHEISFPRQCVFAGTTNADEYLIDHTGNRRFWAIACGDIDLQSLKRDRNQLWAEAVVRYRAGEPWHLTGELIELAAVEADERIAHDPWTATVLDVLQSATEISPGEVLNRMALADGERHSRNASRVGQILRSQGWQAARRDRTRGQLYTKNGGVKL